MKNLKRLFSSVLIVGFISAIIGATLFVGCQQEPKTIKIGAILPLTGNLAHIGELTKQGIVMGLAKVNTTDMLGNKKLEAIYEDSKGEVKTAIAGVNRLIAVEKAQIIFSTISPVCLGIKPILEEKNILHLGFTPAVGFVDNTKSTVRLFISSEQSMELLGDYIIRKNFRKVGILYIDDDFGKGQLSSLKKQLKKDINLFEEGYTFATRDFKSLLIKLRKFNPDVIVMLNYGGATDGILLKQLRESKIKLPIVGNFNMAQPEIKKLSPEILEGIVFTSSYYDAGIPNAAAEEFKKEYTNKFGGTPVLPVAYAYDAILVIAKCLKESDYDIKKLRETLLSIKDFEGVTGKMSFLPNGDFRTDLILAVYKNGIPVPIEQQESVQ